MYRTSLHHCLIITINCIICAYLCVCVLAVVFGYLVLGQYTIREKSSDTQQQRLHRYSSGMFNKSVKVYIEKSHSPTLSNAAAHSPLHCSHPNLLPTSCHPHVNGCTRLPWALSKQMGRQTMCSTLSERVQALVWRYVIIGPQKYSFHGETSGSHPVQNSEGIQD